MTVLKNVYVITAPSGTGKTTLNRRLVSDFADIEISRSSTTRPIRKGETNGDHYWFVDKETFQKQIKANEMLEWAEIYGNFYGTSIKELERIAANNHKIILEIDPQGWEQVRKILKDSHSIFILPPSVDSLWQRLTGRGTDALEVAWRRIKAARRELDQASNYQYFIVNDDLETAYNELKNLIYNDQSVKLGKEEGVARSKKLVEDFDRADWFHEMQKKFG